MGTAGAAAKFSSNRSETRYCTIFNEHNLLLKEHKSLNQRFPNILWIYILVTIPFFLSVYYPLWITNSVTNRPHDKLQPPLEVGAAPVGNLWFKRSRCKRGSAFYHYHLKTTKWWNPFYVQGSPHGSVMSCQSLAARAFAEPDKDPSQCVAFHR